MVERPQSIVNAGHAVMGLVLLMGLTALLTFVLRDDLVRAWAEDNEVARAALAEGGLIGLEESSIRVPAFVPIAVSSFVVFAALALVLVSLLRGGANWARLSLTVMAASGVGVIALGLRADPPVLFLVVSVVSILLYAALLYFLWQKDSSDFLRRV